MACLPELIGALSLIGTVLGSTLQRIHKYLAVGNFFRVAGLVLIFGVVIG